MKKETVEVCCNCGKIAEDKDKKGKLFKCSRCGSDVSVVMSKEMFLKIAGEYGKEE